MTHSDLFTNPYRDPAVVPAKYRAHARLAKLFQPDGTCTRPLEDPVTLWAVTVLHEKYGVPLEAMRLEITEDFAEGAHQAGSGRRVLPGHS